MTLERVRVNGTAQSTSALTTWRMNTGVVTTESYGPAWAQFKGNTSSMSDHNPTPQFRKRIAAGEIIMGDMALYRKTRQYDSSSAIFPLVWGKVELTGDVIGWLESASGAAWTPLNSSTYVGIGSNVSLCAAYAALKRSDLMAGEMLGSLGQTVQMLRRPFSGGIKLFSEMKKFRASRMKRFGHSIVKASSDTWLEYRYGWKPLIMDGQTIIQLAGKKSSLTRRLVGRGSSHYTLPQEIAWSSHGSGSVPGTHGATFKRTGNKTGRVNSGVIAEVNFSSTSEQVAANLGLRAQDVPATVWELIPYSFVVDWFCNVGSWVTAITPSSTLTVRGSWTTKVETTSHICWAEALITDSGVTYKRDVGQSYLTWDDVTRVANPQLPIAPVLTMKPLSALHAVDALALISQRILQGLRSFRH